MLTTSGSAWCRVYLCIFRGVGMTSDNKMTDQKARAAEGFPKWWLEHFEDIPGDFGEPGTPEFLESCKATLNLFRRCYAQGQKDLVANLLDWMSRNAPLTEAELKRLAGTES